MSKKELREIILNNNDVYKQVILGYDCWVSLSLLGYDLTLDEHKLLDEVENELMNEYFDEAK